MTLSKLSLDIGANFGSFVRTSSLEPVESSMTKVAGTETLVRTANRCVQVMGGLGLTDTTIVKRVFREVRAFRIYDGPTEIHKWSLANKIKRNWKVAQA